MLTCAILFQFRIDLLQALQKQFALEIDLKKKHMNESVSIIFDKGLKLWNGNRSISAMFRT